MNKFQRTEDEVISEMIRMWDEDHQKGIFGKLRYIFPEHPFDWSVGYDGQNRRTIMFSFAAPQNILKTAKEIPSNGVVCTEAYNKSKSRLELSFSLVNEDVLDVFLPLCKDLILVSATCNTEKAALAQIQDRFKLWRAMLGHRKTKQEAVKGLIGELLMMVQMKEMGYSPKNIIEGWVGPDNADQDFIFTNIWFEVKAVQSSAQSVKINSADQLDRGGEGWLYVFQLDNASKDTQGALCVHSLAEYVKEHVLANDVTALESFQEKLSTSGLDLVAADTSIWVVKRGFQRFQITEDFPRLTHEIKKPEIDTIKYTLLLAQLNKWKG